MKAQLTLVVLVVVVALAGGWWVLSVPAEGPVLTGYVEGEALYFAAPWAGPLARLAVERGDQIEAGAQLFQIDSSIATAQLRQAEAALAAARARVEDLYKGERPQQLAVLAAQRTAARATLQEARTERERTLTLTERGALPAARLDQVLADYDRAEARVDEITNQLAAARLGARTDQVVAAEAEVVRAQAVLTEARLRLEQLAPSTPTAGRVEETFFAEGEWVPANQPVLSVLPSHRITIRFFIPQADLPRYPTGQIVRFWCDGCGPAQEARILRISSRPEYTPPVIYSRDSRDRMMFLAEALPVERESLSPGQPIDVLPVED